MSGKVVFLFVTVVLACALALAQGGRTQSPSGGTGTTTTQPSRPSRSPDMNRPLFLTGRVITDDGSPLKERAAIERLCGGRVVREAYTDSQGNFSFQLGGAANLSQAADAADEPALSGGRDSMGRPAAGEGWGRPSASGDSPIRPLSEGQQRELELKTCELRASLPGYRSDLLRLAGYTSFDSNVGTIVVHPLGKVEGSMVSVTTLQAPGKAKKAMERAQKATAKEDLPEAERQLQEAVRIYPKFAQAWLELGLLMRKTNRGAEARKAFEQAREADPKFIAPYYHLAVMAAQESDWRQVAELTDKALALNAYEYFSLYFYNSAAYFNLNNLEQAEKSARSARRLDSQYQNPRIDLLLSRILELRNDYTGAAEQLRSFLKHAPSAPDADQVRARLAELESKVPPAKP